VCGLRSAQGTNSTRIVLWIGPERVITDTARFYDEFEGTLRPDVNTEGIRRATEDYHAARNAATR
jgi:hypothetical protein